MQRKSGKTNWTWLIMGAVGLGAAYFYFTSSKANASTIVYPPVAVTPPNTSKYILGYWAWKIKKTTEWWLATTKKAKLSTKTVDSQLWEDAQLKLTNSSVPGSDLDAFIKAVDAKVLISAASMPEDVKFSNAIYFVVNSVKTAFLSANGTVVVPFVTSTTKPLEGIII